MLLVNNPNGGEHLKEVLARHISWMQWQQLIYAAIISLAVLVVWIRSRAKIGSLGFCLLFAITIVQAIVIAALLLKLAILKKCDEQC